MPGVVSRAAGHRGGLVDRLRLGAVGVLRSLSALCWRTWSCCSCPGFSDQLWASTGQMNGGACRDWCAPRHAAAHAVNGCWRASTPRCDQHLARDRGLGRVALAVAGLGVGVEPVPLVGRTPGLLRVLDRCPAQRVRASLGNRSPFIGPPRVRAATTRSGTVGVPPPSSGLVVNRQNWPTQAALTVLR